jgi:hypothetical protein
MDANIRERDVDIECPYCYILLRLPLPGGRIRGPCCFGMFHYGAFDGPRYGPEAFPVARPNEFDKLPNAALHTRLLERIEALEHDPCAEGWVPSERDTCHGAKIPFLRLLALKGRAQKVAPSAAP